jgi:hypothetical protein
MDSPAVWQELLKQGVLGIIVLLEFYAIVILWKKLGERDAAISTLQEARLADVRKCTEALVECSTAMNNAAETNGELQESLRSILSEYQLRARGRP